MKIGICSLAFRDRDVFDVVPLVADMGYDEIEIWANHLEGKSPAQLEELRELSVRKGITVSGIAPYFWLTQDEALLAESLQIASRCIEQARALGAGMIRTFTDAGPTGIGSAEATAEHWQTAVEALRKITSQAPDLIFAVETHEKTLADTPATTERLLREVGAVNLRILYQPFEEGDLIGDCERFLPNIRQVHLNPHIGPADSSSLLTCGIDYAGLLTCLRKAGYSGSVAVEFCARGMDHTTSAREAITWCREVLGQSSSTVCQP